MAQTRDAVLEFKDVWKVYSLDSVQVPAIKGVNLRVNEGEFVAVIGASGSGKSTALNLIGVMDSPTKGTVLLDGVDLAKLADDHLARIRGKKIGFVFQTFNLYPTLDVFENIALPLRIHEYPEEEIKRRVSRLAAMVGIDQRLSHLPSQLSGGERQRVAIARALAPQPSMLLADEPTGNLDSKTSHEIMKLFVQLHEKEGKTIIMVTHERDIAAYAQRVVELKDGQIIYDEKNSRRNKRG